MTDTTTEEAPQAIAEIVPVTIAPAVSMRCARCNAQAYIEIEMPSGTRWELCAHDFEIHETKLVLEAKRIIDHRPFLRKQEGH